MLFDKYHCNVEVLLIFKSNTGRANNSSLYHPFGRQILKWHFKWNFWGKSIYCPARVKEKWESALPLLPPKDILFFLYLQRLRLYSLLTEGDFGCRLVEGASQHWSIYTWFIVEISIHRETSAIFFQSAELDLNNIAFAIGKLSLL